MPVKQIHVFATPGPEVQADLIRRAMAAWFDTNSQGASDETSGFVMQASGKASACVMGTG